MDFMEEWWQNLSYFLKDTNSKEMTKHKVRTTLVVKILDQRKSELEDLSIKNEEYAIICMKQMTETHKAVLIIAPGSSTSLTAAKNHRDAQ